MRLKLKKIVKKLPPDFPPEVEKENPRPQILKKHRLVTLQIDIMVPDAVDEDEAEKLVKDTLQIDCWVGEVHRIETVFVDTLL